MEIAIVVTVLALLYFGKEGFKEKAKEIEEDMLVGAAEAAPERAKRVQEAYKKLQEIKKANDNKLVGAQDVLKEARGES